jgi:CHAT domain-containing protein
LPPSFDDIQRASRIAPLIYISSARHGGLALVIEQSSGLKVTGIELPNFDIATLRQQVRHYHDYYSHRQTEKASWLSALDGMTSWLWDVAIGPVLRRLSNRSQAVLIPCGLVGLLPLHAAWTTRRGGRRRYALDRRTLTYAPNARSLTVVATSLAPAAADSILTVSNPQPTAQIALPFSSYESKAISNLFGSRTVIRGRRASRARVARALQSVETVHVACHALADPHDPLRSGVVLAGDEMLTVADLLQARLERTRLVVMSACDTAVPGEQLPDEVMSIATAFLQAGADGVVASLWSVLDESTMLLMARFYELWRHRKQSAALALRNAQRWMRTTPDRRKAEQLQHMLPSRLYLQLKASPPRVTRFSHPVHWAAFSYFGAPLVRASDHNRRTGSKPSRREA